MCDMQLKRGFTYGLLSNSMHLRGHTSLKYPNRASHVLIHRGPIEGISSSRVSFWYIILTDISVTSFNFGKRQGLAYANLVM